MSFDLSWLWDTLQGLVTSIQSWFGDIWSAVEQIGNTGQGIFAGLVNFASTLWDAMVRFADLFGKWISDAFSWIYEGLQYWANEFGKWFGYAFSYLQNGLQWIASQIYGFGEWIYNGLQFIWNWIVNSITGLYNAIAEFFSGIATAVGDWWNSVISGVNSWFTGLLTGIRTKIVNTIMADVSIYFGWKAVERITQMKSAKDGMYGLLGLFSAPVAGYLFGNIVNGLIPTPSTEPMELIPSINPFSYSPPSLSITTPTPPTRPTAPTIPEVPPTPFVGALSKDLSVPSLEYAVTTVSKDKDLSVPSLSYDYVWLHQPVSDISTGNWTSTPLYQKLQKGTDNTTTYITSKSLDTGQSDTFQVGLSALPTPPSRTDHKVHVYAKKSASGGRYVDLDVYLYEGATLRHHTGWTDISENWGDFVASLSEAEAEAITDYSNLRVTVTASVSGGATGTRQCNVARVYMERPIST